MKAGTVVGVVATFEDGRTMRVGSWTLPNAVDGMEVAKFADAMGLDIAIILVKPGLVSLTVAEWRGSALRGGEGG